MINILMEVFGALTIRIDAIFKTLRVKHKDTASQMRDTGGTAFFWFRGRVNSCGSVFSTRDLCFLDHDIG